ncbi:MAG: 5-(carboxyamino)imidazole ribonucleotide synthase [Actinobacteria bacterium]|nr:5-(carboxyamino)imidazole ribonucleotide synthase [Actinomycetota bacterium]MCL5446087.1 5-(carboxyamino)imidazole ribonucleotide synthase [Actinomycetota bacterium]
MDNGERRRPRVGMVGAGQLARMTYQAAVSLDVEMSVLSDSANAPAVLAGAPRVPGTATSIAALRHLAAGSDVVTFDHEGVPAGIVSILEHERTLVRPSSEALLLAQDKLAGRRRLDQAGFPMPPYCELDIHHPDMLDALGEKWGWPLVLKARTGGYDGRGVIIADRTDARRILAGGGPETWFAEAAVDIATEVAVVAARSPSGAWEPYPLIETTQEDGICRELVMPARVPARIAKQALDTAEALASWIGATGIIAVEMFVTRQGGLVLNELAVRPHNSGHVTIEGAVTSQFENHLRAILDWPLGSAVMVSPAAAMVNVLGSPDGADPRDNLVKALSVRNARVHLYGKEPAPGRKLGHVTALAPTHEEALSTARACASLLSGE